MNYFIQTSHNRIQLWFLQLSSLENVNIPRCLQDQQSVKSKGVVTLVDASQQAFGASSYLRCEYEDGTVTSRLIASKSKVAALTPMTVPRLELIGAIEGLRLTQSVSRTLGLPIKGATFYLDSTESRERKRFPALCRKSHRSNTNWHRTISMEGRAPLNLPSPDYGGMVLSG